MKNYYEILGITDEEQKLTGDAFNEICKKKYHSLALKYHPDRWANETEEKRKEAEEKFKDIAEANEVLSDPQKRARYDNGGTDFNFEGFDPMDMFMRMNGFGGGFGGFGFDPFGNGRFTMKGSDVYGDVDITLEEAYNGCKKNVEYRKSIKCRHCNGTGSSDGLEHKCKTCGGKGTVTHQQRQMGNRIFQSMTTCPACHGTGVEKNISHCKHCKGSGYEEIVLTEKIDIPKGVGDNMVFRVEGLGNEPNGPGIPGDLMVRVHAIENDYFKRPDVVNLVHYEYVPFNEAMLGFKKDFKCIDGSEVTVFCKELTKPGETFFFKGKGMPDPNNPNFHGDYAVVINYKLPEKLTNKQKELLRNFNKI